MTMAYECDVCMDGIDGTYAVCRTCYRKRSIYPGLERSIDLHVLLDLHDARQGLDSQSPMASVIVKRGKG